MHVPIFHHIFFHLSLQGFHWAEALGMVHGPGWL